MPEAFEKINLQQKNNSQKSNKTCLGNNTGVSIESELDVQLMSQSGNGMKLGFWQSSMALFICYQF